MEKRKKGGQIKDKQNIRRMVFATLRFMIRTAWRERPALFGVYALLFASQCMRKVQIVILPKFLLDELMLVVEGAPVKEHLQGIIFYAALICGVNLLANVLDNIAYQTRNVMQEWFNEYFEVQLADHAMRIDFEHTENPAALDQLNRAKEGISWYSGGVVGVLNGFYDIVINCTVILGVGAVIVLTCPLLLPIQIVGLLLITVFNAKNNKYEIEEYGRLAKTNREFGYFCFQLADFSYGKDIRLYDSAEMMCRKSSTIAKKQMESWFRLARKQCKCTWGMDIANALRDGFSYFYIGYLALTKVIGIGDFTMCVAAASELYHGMRGIVFGCQDVVKRCNYAYQYLEFLNYPAAMPKGDKAVLNGKHTIEFSHVSFRYPRSEQFVLENVNLTISSGEHLAVVGLNGAGKTTFIKLLCRLYDVTEGQILIDGVDIREYSEEEYRKLFAVVFQDFKLFAFSLRENISFGEAAGDEEIQRVLELAGFYEDAEKLPEGLDTMIYKSFDEHGVELSGGQQQKTAISRALYRNAPIVILDEPTAALDPMAEYDIYRHFDCLVGNKTAIYISHRLSSCKFCHRIAVFADRTIKEYGTHEELVGIQDGIYAKMFEAQAKYFTPVQAP